MSTQDATIFDLISISSTLPQRHEEELPRESALATIDMQLRHGHSSVALIGESACGKTTILRQYVEKYPLDAVNLFLDPKSTFIGTYELAVRELGTQLHFLSAGTLPAEDASYPVLIRESIPVIARNRRLANRPLFIVIDGLFDLDPNNIELVQSIINLLPRNINSIHYLFSATPSGVQLANQVWGPLQPQAVTPLILEETRRLVGARVDDEEDIQTIQEATVGHIGQVKSIVRLLDADVSLSEIMEGKPRELQQYYEIEWNKVELQDEKLRTALATIVFLPDQFSLKDVAQISDVEFDRLQSTLEEISFVRLVNVGESIVPRIESHPFRKHLEQKLSNLRDSSINRAIEYCENQASESEHKHKIPEFLELKGDDHALANYLTPEVLTQRLRTSQSVTAVIETLRMGLKAANRSAKAEKGYFFSVASASLIDLLDNEALEKQVDYLLGSENYTKALSFCRSIFSVEARLLALCKVVREMTRQDIDVGADQKAEIQAYVSQVAESIPEERALDVASELIFFDQTNAIALLENVAQRTGNDNAFDWFVARLAHRNIESESKESFEIVYSSIKSDVSEPVRQGLGVVRELFRSTQDSRELIKRLQAIDSVQQRIFLARAYLNANVEVSEKVALSLALIKQTIAADNYRPNSRTYADLTACLRAVPNVTEESTLLEQLVVGQLSTIKDVGPTPEYYQTRLHILFHRSAAGKESLSDGILDLLVELSGDDLDPDVSIACLARLKDVLADVRGDESDDCMQLDALIDEKLESDVERIIKETAEHDDALMPLFRNAFARRSKKYFELLARVNTRDRRNRIARKCIKEIIGQRAGEDFQKEDLAFIDRVLQAVEGASARSQAYIYIAKEMCRQINEIDAETITLRKEYAERLIAFMKDRKEMVCAPKDRLLHLADLLRIVEKVEPHQSEQIAEDLKRDIDSSYRLSTFIDGTPEVCLDLARYKSCGLQDTKAQELDEADLSSIFRAEALETPVTRVLNLIMRAVAQQCEMLPAQSTQSIDSVGPYVNILASELTRCAIWAHLASLLCDPQPNTSRYIMDHYALPIYQRASECDNEYSVLKFSLLEMLGPTLWSVHRSFFEREITNLNEDQQDLVLRQVFDFKIKGQVVGEPSSPDGHWRALQYPEVGECIDLIERMHSDALIWGSIQKLVNMDGRYSIFRKLRTAQVNEVGRRFEELVRVKLPYEGGVSHTGYAVLAKLTVDARIKRLKLSEANLVHKVDEIPNVSDRAFIYGMLVNVIPSKQEKVRRSMFSKAVDCIEAIPSARERLDRARLLIQESRMEFPEQTKECVNKWFKGTVSSESQATLTSQRELVDTIYQHDEEWGASIASIAGIDDEQTRTAKMLEKKRKEFEVTSKVKDRSCESIARDEVRYYSKVFTRGLSQLNANGYSSLQHGDIGKDLEFASYKSLSSVFSVFAFCTAMTLKNVPVDKKMQVAMYLIEELKYTLATLQAAIDGPVKRTWQTEHTPRDSNESFQFVGANGRVRALEFFHDWLVGRECQEVLIVDPYYDLNEIDVIRYAQESNRSVDITILSGAELISDGVMETDVVRRFQNIWNERYSDESPPSVTFVAAYYERDNKCPVHDRWIIADGDGIQLGTSLNGLGQKDSSVIHMGREQAAQVRENVQQYVDRKIKAKGGKTIRYVVLPLA